MSQTPPAPFAQVFWAVSSPSGCMELPMWGKTGGWEGQPAAPGPAAGGWTSQAAVGGEGQGPQL